MVKVVRTDNFCRECIPEECVAGPGLTPEEAKRVADEKNTRGSDSYYYMVKEDSYVLFNPHD
jgi:hypothetical protein